MVFCALFSGAGMAVKNINNVLIKQKNNA